MKILELNLKNINSLAGVWNINFTAPGFTDNGIFAITGKTGSGKSSVLDAISLALYGKTPRVDVTGASNDLMTRGASDCFAEIIFECNGKKWKASWKQECTKTGNLKQIERCVADENNHIIADKISIKGAKRNKDEKTVDETIEEILGLNFEQFTKVILLAQGSFAAFLQASPGEKGELLEQITGTEIYGEISKHVFERNKMESQKLEKADIELAAIRTLPAEAIEKIEAEIAGFEKQKTETDQELQVIEILFEKLKEFDTIIEEKNKALHAAVNAARLLETEIESAGKDLNVKTDSFSLAEKNLRLQTEREVQKNKELEVQKTALTEVLNHKPLSDYHREKEKITGFGKEIGFLTNDIERIIENQRKFEENRKVIEENTKEIAALSAKIEANRKWAESRQKEIAQLQEIITLRKTIQNYEEQRKILEDGKACPLCGSLEHPFAQGNIPEVDEKESELKTKNQELKDLNRDLLNDEKRLAKLESDQKNALSNNRETALQITESRNKITQRLPETGNLGFEISENEDCIRRLKQIREQKLNEYHIIKEKITAAEKLEGEIALLRDSAIPQIKSGIELKRNEMSGFSNEITRLKTLIQEKQKQAEAQKSNIENLQKEKQNLEREQNAEKAKLFAGKTLEDLQSEKREKKQKAEDFLRKTGAHKQSLKENERLLKISREKSAAKEAQQKISIQWENLNKLIGAADGKKFRNYAQALTFENLTLLANRELQKMSDRYILKRTGDASNPFELSVIDQFQNGEERTAQNLSGGEKFIVSLSLALGLSNMASKNMRIDTMFIDEGFGTLDSEYLDLALSALNGLQSEGKLIGVISHLAELKERIATHIEIIPQGNGYSKIEIR
ncbi:MAG: AAA family ATPase [Fibrobacter sp.]|jgi:exonuclease SbcC|nr:AAA family ATPase [Fibrobacter sp.]